MLTLKVPDMTCGHCASVVTRAVHSVDSGADIAIDLPTQTVSITSAADTAQMIEALDAAGYSAMLD